MAKQLQRRQQPVDLVFVLAARMQVADGVQRRQSIAVYLLMWQLPDQAGPSAAQDATP
ncbi:hypothetical protein PRZ03_12170 [Paucibacter sp. hw8]|uniref:Uncharacterized protein n=1 Tax=Roseateles albus TaxID=2987525 RepID=A0ABT5KET3_9BURK|nr:hypothetical protein [Roseateles albus]